MQSKVTSEFLSYVKGCFHFASVYEMCFLLWIYCFFTAQHLGKYYFNLSSQLWQEQECQTQTSNWGQRLHFSGDILPETVL